MCLEASRPAGQPEEAVDSGGEENLKLLLQHVVREVLAAQLKVMLRDLGLQLLIAEYLADAIDGFVREFVILDPAR